MEPDDLYGLPLDRFVAERGALAKALRASKQREDASAVAALRKPSTAAWAVNQVVRARPRELQALLDAGDALRQAQSDLLAGRVDGRELRAVADRERAAVDELVGAARGLLSSEGIELSATVLERVAETLHAAALDDEARERVRGATLVQELRHVGFGLGGSEAAAAPTRRSPSAARERDAREEAARAHAEARKQARGAEAVARRACERAEHAVRSAEQRRDRAAEALDKAEAALTAARATAAAAREQQQRARRALDGL